MHKKSHPLPAGLETLLGVGGRHGLKGGVKTFMNWLRTQHPKVYLDTAFIFTSPEAAGVKNVFQGAIIVVGTLIENLGDALKVHELIMEPIEIIFGDLPGAVEDFFDANKPVFPADYKKPELTADGVKAVAKQFNDLITSWLRGILRNWWQPALSFFERTFGRFVDPRQRVFKNLARLPDPVIKEFMIRISNRTTEGHIPEEDYKYLAQCLNLMDEYDEMMFMATRTTAQLKQLIAWAKTINDQSVFKRIYRGAWEKYHQNWPAIEKYMWSALEGADRSLQEAVTTLEWSNDRRQQVIDRERLAATASRPQRNLSRDPRILVVIGFVVTAALTMGLLYLGGCRHEAPVVTIVSPVNHAQVIDAPLITGEVRDREDIARMDYEVNGGNRIPIKVGSARRMHWQVKLDSLSYGMLHVKVYAFGHNGEVGSSELHLFRPVPEPPDTNRSVTVVDSTAHPATPDSVRASVER